LPGLIAGRGPAPLKPWIDTMTHQLY